jgi:hypothetical protein
MYVDLKKEINNPQYPRVILVENNDNETPWSED